MLIDGDSFCASQLRIVPAWCGPMVSHLLLW
jgi:hypothetical protein